jgi:hypothetical protein
MLYGQVNIASKILFGLRFIQVKCFLLFLFIFTSNVNAAVPGKVTGLSVPLTAAVNTSFNVSWDPQPTATYYRIIVSGSYLPNASSTTISQTYSTLGSRFYDVKACNADGCGSFSSGTNRRVDIYAVNIKPTVSISFPVTGQLSFSTSTAIQAGGSGSDSDGTISEVSFRIDGGAWQPDTASPYTANFGTQSVGSHLIHYRSKDNDGAYSSILSRTITVYAPNVKPTVSPTSPTSGSNFPTTQNVIPSANASDSDGSIQQVEFKMDSGSWQVDTSSPYSVNLGTQSAGNHTIYYRSLDNENAYSNTASRNIVVAAPNVKPTVSISFPVTGQLSFSTSTAIQAGGSGSDSDGTISEVSFRIDGGAWQPDTASPYTANFGTQSVGSHLIHYRSKDNDGAYSSILSRTITVYAPNVKPTVSPTSPTSGSNFPTTQNIIPSANASDSDGSIKQVEFKMDSGSWQVDTSSPYSINLGNQSAGDHTIYYRSKDNEDAYSNTVSRNIVVTAPNIKPTVSISFPVTGQLSFSISTAIQAGGSGSDSDGTISEVSFRIDGGAWQPDTASPYTANFGTQSVGSHTIYYRSKDNEGLYSDILSRTITVYAQQTPVTPSKPIATGEGTINTLSWDVLADHYEVDVQLDGGEWQTDSATFENSPATWDNLIAGSRVYRIRACDSTNICSENSPDSDAVVTISIPAKPVAIGSGTTNTLAWEIAADHYEVDIQLDDGEWVKETQAYTSSPVTWEGLTAGSRKYLIRACNMDNVCSDSSPVSDVVVTEDAPDGDIVLINFNEYPPLSYGGSQDTSGSVTVAEQGATLVMTGNLWKKVNFPYTITDKTVLEFDFSSAVEGEIHGIGFDTDNAISADRTFKLYGTQNWGNTTYSYNGNGETQHFIIPVGQHYTGTVANLFFVLDHDVGNSTGNNVFSNVRVYEAAAEPIPNAPAKPIAIVDGNTNSLSWTSVAEATYYEVDVQLGEGEWVKDTKAYLTPPATWNYPYAGSRIYRIRACNVDNACSANSPVSDVVVTEDAPDGDLGLINFNEYPPLSYGGSQDTSGSVTVAEQGATLVMTGNLWKKVNFPYTITDKTVLEFDFSSAVEGEIHGIGFDTDNAISADRTFKLYGTQNWGNTTYSYNGNGETQHFIIPVGQHYTGTVANLFFVLDHDVGNPTGNNVFSNVRVYEASIVDVTYSGSGEGETTTSTDEFIASAAPASGNEGVIQKVEFSLDGVNWNEGTMQGDGSYQYDFGMLDVGDYTLYIRVNGGYVETVDFIVDVPQRRVIFIHTDLLGSPAAETNEQGSINQ